MIVKNETKMLKECLDSVYKYIDYWVINDNGSTDGTQQFVKDYFAEKGIPGELNEVEWKGFGETRTEALRACDGKTKWILMIDADDFINGELPVEQLNDEMDGYSLFIRRGRLPVVEKPNLQGNFGMEIHRSSPRIRRVSFQAGGRHNTHRSSGGWVLPRRSYSWRTEYE